MGFAKRHALCAALWTAVAARAAAWCPPPHFGPPSGAAVIAEIHGARPGRERHGVYSSHVARFVWWHVAVMGFERVHLVVFHSASVAAPTAADVYGASSCVAAWVASGGLSWETRIYFPVHHAGLKLDEQRPAGWNAIHKSGAIAETYEKIRKKYDWVAVLDVDEFFFANASAPAAPHGAGAGAALHGRGAQTSRDAPPVLVAIEATLRALAPRTPAAARADIFSGVASLCAPGFSFVNPGPQSMPSLRSAEADPYRFRAVPAPAKDQAHCWKSMHRTAAVTHLTSHVAMHKGPGPTLQAERGAGALAVAHLNRQMPPRGDSNATAIDSALVQLARRFRPHAAVNRQGEP
ncbi:hypothetical protein M885DRAFT_589283 [Pelagophyceae sp. CCMP2097]|nr:hypothetical protein M885DRAFT_589283 [Pelagophyceae sp. CCMP2097]